MILVKLLKTHERIALTCFEKEHHFCHRHCVSDYLKNHQDEGKPTEVIVTGGQNNQLYLKYVTHIEHDSSVA